MAGGSAVHDLARADGADWWIAGVVATRYRPGSARIRTREERAGLGRAALVRPERRLARSRSGPSAGALSMFPLCHATRVAACTGASSIVFGRHRL